MPHFHRGPATIYYEEFGAGFPLLLLAPGSLNSSIEWWSRDSTPMNPIADPSGSYRATAMDQLAPIAEFVPEWKEGAALEAARRRVGEFLARQTP
jgi:pimeloyl-ACP methyl ester carboxylesterase